MITIRRYITAGHYDMDFLVFEDGYSYMNYHETPWRVFGVYSDV